MAGIGFQLKKLYDKNGLLVKIKAYFYSVIVTIGPSVICISIITTLNYLLKYLGVSLRDIEILQATIMYGFIFSLLVCSGYCMVLSRYLSDKIYAKKYEDILPSLYGALTVIVSIAAVIGIVFYARSSINFFYKLLGYILFIELIIQTLLSTYISALKNYRRISFAFIIGFALGITIAIIMHYTTDMNYMIISFISFDIGLFIIILILSHEIQKYFKVKSEKYFEFLVYFKKYKILFFTNTFFTLGLYIHNFVMWTVPSINYVVENTYIYSPTYDIPAFYSFLTIIPTMVIFVVKLETAFFFKYSDYFKLINSGACYEDIELMKKEMKEVLYRELTYIMEIQLFFTIGFIILGMKLLPLIGFTSYMIDEFNILCLAYYSVIMIFVYMTILLYFEDRKGAVFIAFIFCISNLILTLISVLGGSVYYGLGMFIAGLGTLCVGIYRLKYFIDNIDYFVFCKHCSWSDE